MKPNETIMRVDAVPDANAAYFAGANSAGGFVSFYPEIFDERSLARLYAIKGGPGSGKSGVMRRFLRAACGAGLSTEAYLCGSDPDSLDAAIARGEGGAVALIDATSPHAYDLRFPGAAARLFDCGEFWDAGALRSHRAAIEALSDAKSVAYRRAYRYLAALGDLRRDLRRLGEDALDVRKMRAACRRFALSLSAAKSAGAFGAKEGARRCANCFSMRGRAAIDFAPDFDTVAVTDCAATAGAMITALRGELEAAGIEVLSVVDCVEPDETRGLIVPSHSMRVVVCADRPTEGAVKNFNMTRFLRRDALAETKSRRSFAAKCAATLADGASAALADAGEAHFALEDVYVAAMDFDSLGAAADEMIAEAVGIALAR